MPVTHLGSFAPAAPQSYAQVLWTGPLTPALSPKGRGGKKSGEGNFSLGEFFVDPSFGEFFVDPSFGEFSVDPSFGEFFVDPVDHSSRGAEIAAPSPACGRGWG